MADKASLKAHEKISERRSTSLTAIVRDAIEAMIISGELGAGHRINESALAKRLGVSRGPIREACRSMEQARLLVSVANQGVFVREMSLDEARNLYEVRGALSGLVGRLVAEKSSDDTLKSLENLVSGMESAVREKDVNDYFKLNLQFHDLLVEAAENPALKESYRAVINQIQLYRRYGLVQEGSLKVSLDEHRAIVNALAERDAEAAEEAMRRHVAGGWARMSAAV